MTGDLSERCEQTVLPPNDWARAKFHDGRCRRRWTNAVQVSGRTLRVCNQHFRVLARMEAAAAAAASGGHAEPHMGWHDHRCQCPCKWCQEHHRYRGTTGHLYLAVICEPGCTRHTDPAKRGTA